LGLEFRVEVSAFGVQGLSLAFGAFGVVGLGARVQGLESRVWGLGSRVSILPQYGLCR